MSPISRLVRPAALLRVEGAVMLAASLMLYGLYGGGWLLLVVLILAPDLSMLGYARGPRLGGAVYNTFHTYPLPAILAVWGTISGASLPVSLALIWFAHIGMDRMLGYGLKGPGGFRETHLGQL